MIQPEATVIDFGAFAQQCRADATPKALGQLAESLGVSRESLDRLAVGWSVQDRAWSFPMSNAAGDVTGIRLRLPSGRKLSVKGGREGLFIPSDFTTEGRLLICEGPTDAAALLDLGFPDVIGRPSCSGGVQHVCDLIRRLHVTNVFIVADADAPGQRGAESLAGRLLIRGAMVRIITPPAGIKDARQWKGSGASGVDVSYAFYSAPMYQATITTKKGRKTWARRS
ncbi:MAG: toprim domain-containing protein [Planctomycetia bacterium]|nr:toprim domain-containing protein [Planctomycetia bacterium]